MGRDRLRSNQGGEVGVSVLNQHFGPRVPTRLVSLATLPRGKGNQSPNNPLGGGGGGGGFQAPLAILPPLAFTARPMMASVRLGS